MNVVGGIRATMQARDLADGDTPVLLMVSGGSDSTALAYIAAELAELGDIGPLTMLHVNHRLRGQDADEDAEFVVSLAHMLQIPVRIASVDVAQIAQQERGNIEAVARRERYRLANEALADLCLEAQKPISAGRIFVAHTADDRIENFYMRSIVGTGPGGFRSMLYLNGQVARPLLDASRQALRDYVLAREKRGLPVLRDGNMMAWREDATNAHTDRFRSYVRHEIVPRAKDRNQNLVETLTRTMNLIGDEDDMISEMADDAFERHVRWFEPLGQGCLLLPSFGLERAPLKRRVVMKVFECMLGTGERVETASVEAVLAAFYEGKPNGGYVVNVQGNLAVSANKQGVRIEPMASFRTRRKRM